MKLSLRIKLFLFVPAGFGVFVFLLLSMLLLFLSAPSDTSDVNTFISLTSCDNIDFWSTKHEISTVSMSSNLFS